MDVIDKVLIALGEFHATTYHYMKTFKKGDRETFLKKYPFFETTTFYEMTNKNDLILDTMIDTMLDNLAAMFEAEEGQQEIAGKLKRMKPLWKERAIAAARPLKDDFVTVVHGDAWYKNIMTK